MKGQSKYLFTTPKNIESSSKLNNRLIRKIFYRSQQLKHFILGSLTQIRNHLIIILVMLVLTSLAIFLANQRISSVTIQIHNQTLINSNDIAYYKTLLIHKRFFLISSNRLASLLKNKDKRLKNVSVLKTRPGHININITEKNYLAKFKGNQHYYAITQSKDIILISQKQFTHLQLPQITGIKFQDIHILKEPIIDILLQIQEASQHEHIFFRPVLITATTDRWHIPSITIKYTDHVNNSAKQYHTAIFSPNKPTNTQIWKFIAFLKGASRQHLHYKTVDLRFDRLVIK